MSRLLTLGAPLGDATVKENLKGASLRGDHRHPENIHFWDNVAAEDDFISYDQKLKDDFAHMVPDPCERITDHRIYNFALRADSEGKLGSYPHHGAGYLVHPRVIDIIADWL